MCVRDCVHACMSGSHKFTSICSVILLPLALVLAHALRFVSGNIYSGSELSKNVFQKSVIETFSPCKDTLRHKLQGLLL